MIRPPRAALSPEARGAALVILATMVFGTMDMIAKLLTTRYDPMQVVWARYVGQAVLVALMVAPRIRVVARSRHPGLQVLRSAFLFGSTLAGFFAFSVLPLATVVSVFQVAPLMITAAAALILGEAVGPRRWAGVAAGFVGALIIVRPGTAVFEPASVLPLLGAACFAGYTIITRVLGRDEGFWTTFLYSAVLGAALSSLWMPMVWITPDAADAALMLFMALIGTGGQFLLIAAFANAQASALAPFTYFSLIVAATLGYAVFGDLPDLPTVAGAALIVGSGLYVWHRERVRARA